MRVTLPLKIWNNTRNEEKLEAQQRLLNEARLAALTSQINPHFLFNTLNSISSLIRTDPEQARIMIYRLSNILRRLLRKHENLNPLREELQFIDDYMGIELVRFGDKLRFVKEIDPDTLDRLVPSMLLQPLVENSIKHGLSSKVEGGMIRIRSRLEGGTAAPARGGRRRRYSGSQAGDAVRAGHRHQQCERAVESAFRQRLSDVDRQPARPRDADRDRIAGIEKLPGGRILSPHSIQMERTLSKLMTYPVTGHVTDALPSTIAGKTRRVYDALSLRLPDVDILFPFQGAPLRLGDVGISRRDAGAGGRHRIG